MAKKIYINSKYTQSDFYCTECGKKGIPIIRKHGQQRGAGHLKKLFCIYCQKETNHAEIKPFGTYLYEDFKEEFELGRFVNGEKIPTGELMLCTDGKCPYNKGGRCWNSQQTYDCGHRILERNDDVCQN